MIVYMSRNLTVAALIALMVAAGAVVVLQAQSLIKTQVLENAGSLSLEDRLATEQIPAEEIHSVSKTLDLNTAPTAVLGQIAEALQRIVDRLRGAIDRHRDLADRVEIELTMSEGSDTEIAIVEADIEAAEVAIIAAEEALQEAQDAILILVQAPQPNEVWQIIQERIREAMERLREAQINLLEALEELRRIRLESPGSDRPVDVPAPSSLPTTSPYILW